MTVTIINADCRAALREIAASSVQSCVTSPPYFGLRDYQVDGQIGMEPTPDEFIAALVEVFGEVRRVLRNDGTLWLNLGDSYSAGGRGNYDTKSTNKGNSASRGLGRPSVEGLKPKDLVGIPWRVALALQADGWWWRQWLPWVKRNPMPESTKDRPTSACEVWLMFTKAESYFYDYDAVQRVMAESSFGRLAQDVEAQAGSDRANGGAKTNGPMKAVQREDKQAGHGRRHAGFNERWDAAERKRGVPPRHEGYESSDQSGLDGVARGTRAFRNSDLFFESIEKPHGAVFVGDEMVALDVATKPFRGAHYATFPPDLIAPLIKASSRIGDTVLDPFGGAGTVGVVCEKLGRDSILIEMNPDNAEMARQRIIAETSGSANDRAKAKAGYLKPSEAPLFANIEGSAA
ncbi:MAG: site-specific DNA-methyltransferase [Beijerinckiaceae bacterium]|nr:site-specific DNA-methyltransferase [Beijerinckiaceae bacterium]